jgi:anion-transporting  ArsA/GET3 family ATPase
MREARVLFVTGKGGVGKTTVSAALGLDAAHHGLRTLIVETASDGSLAQIFDQRSLGTTPHQLDAGLFGVRIDPRKLVEDYFTRLLRVPWLADRLLSSSTFSALTAAAPGITEFLLLERILEWLDPGFMRRRRRYDLIIVDGPATGHALKLLRTPRNITTMVPAGPLARTAARLLTLLGDPQRATVVLVSLAEEMAVRETLETHATLTSDLMLHVARPIVNRIFPRHFSAAESAQLDTYGNGGPVFAAARFAIAARREAERHVGLLRRTLGVSPILLRHVFAREVHAGDLRAMGRTLGRALERDSGGS